MKKSISRKMRICTGVLAVFVLLALYLWAALRPGVWLRDAFLYEQADGSFAGKDAYGRYALTIAPGSEETEVCFWRDGTPVHYRLKAEQTLGGASHVEIEREGRLLFAGSAQGEPGDAILWKQYGGLADDIQIVVNGAYSPEDLEPTSQWLYNVAVGRRRETRGNIGFLFPMALLGILLALDVKFPLLFWNLRHSLEVSGGEPSEWYHITQKWSRAAMAMCIAGLAAASFWVH